MGKQKDLSDFVKDRLMTTRLLGQNIFKTLSCMGCSQYAVVSNKSGSRKDNRTGIRVMGAQDSWMHMGSEC